MGKILNISLLFADGCNLLFRLQSGIKLDAKALGGVTKAYDRLSKL